MRWQCRSVLSSAAQLMADGPVVHDLHFANGDWHLDAGHAPLMPSHGAGPDPELLERATPLATFTLTHADTAQRCLSLKVSGVLSLTITRNRCSSDDKSEMIDDPHHGRCRALEFKLLPCVAKLSRVLEGVNTETTDDGGGERVLCMVGDSLLRMRGGGNSIDGPWDWAKNTGDGSNNLEPPVVDDGNILLILRYTKVQTLTTRAVHERQVRQFLLRHCPAGFTVWRPICRLPVPARAGGDG